MTDQRDTLPPAADDARPLVNTVATDALDEGFRETGTHKAQLMLNTRTRTEMTDLSRSVRVLTIAHVVVSTVFLVVALVGGVLGYRFAQGIERRLERLEARP